MTNELTVKQNITPDNWKMIMDVAPVMETSRLFGVANSEQAAAIMLKGYELGLSLTASFEFIHVIDGKPGLSPRGMLALIQQSPNFAGMKIEDIKDDKGQPQACRVWMKRQNGFEYTVEFSLDDAKRAGIIKSGGGWDKYPANMLRWRAVGYCADVVFPDAVGGMKHTDELGADITPEGDILEGQAVEVKTPPVPPKPVKSEDNFIITEPAIPNYGYTLVQLLESVPDEEILAINSNTFPANDEETNLVVHKLVEAGKLTVGGDDDNPNP